jgi:Ca2+-binding EF-hand superfamily protein
MDEDGNGTIDFQEFLLYMLEKVNKQNLCSDII